MEAPEAEDQRFISKIEETSFGERLDYSSPKYRDVWCGVIYYLHLVIIVLFMIYFASLATLPIATTGQEATETSFDVDYDGVTVVMISCAVLGLMIGFCWLSILKRFALEIIKVVLFLNILIWCILVVVSLIYGLIPLFIVSIIFVVIWGLYVWCMWQRIQFASVLLSLSATIIGEFRGTVCVSICMIILTVVWIIIWLILVLTYGLSTASTQIDDEGNTQTVYNPNTWIIFLLFVSLYWGLQVNHNVSHVTSCGVAASWYFTPPSEPLGNTYAAFKRSMTTSFGSICLGSFIVAVLEAIRALVNYLEQRQGSSNLLFCCIKCWLQCIERCIRWFNKYAYAHCAIYGTSFMESASATWSLLSNRGILALINEDITGVALFAGSLISAVLCGVFGGVVAYLFYSDNTAMVTYLAVYGAVAGMVLTLIVLSAIHSAIITLFVCFAEEPAVLYENRRDAFDRLNDSKPDFERIYNEFGLKSV